MENKCFSASLMEWHLKNARDLPWHGETDPYRIWLSEIMLQQTRTETVKGYYRAFLQAFPTVKSLAEADEADVLKRWEGLGYYSRARNLHAAAKIVARERNGAFPTTAKELKALPGIGDYVSGAVASIAFGERVPALDGNQARVLTRVLNIRREIASPAVLYDEAMRLMPREDPGEYNQALMGLGALICTPRNPKCAECPVRALCRARAAGDPESLPVKREKKARRVVQRAIVLVFFGNRVLVQRRGAGLLAGLWEFPGFDGARTPEDAAACLEEMGVDARYIGSLGQARHVFTHLEWHMTGFRFQARAETGGFVFADADELRALAMPTALKVYREEAMRILAEKPLIRRKTMRRTEWRGIERRRHAFAPFEALGLRGCAGLLYMDEVQNPCAVPSPRGEILITHTGCSWLQLAAEGERFWATVMYDASGQYMETYFDIASSVCARTDGEAWFDDLLLDYVLYPDGSMVEIDRDELEQALASGGISKEEYQTAISGAERLKSIICGNETAFFEVCARLRAELMEKMNMAYDAE